MAKIRRVIRKVPTPGRLAVDEQFWPVILALFVLCGFLMGTVAAYFPFGAQHWWQDARAWMFVIPVATCVAVWLLRLLPSQVVRRALQISIVLGLLFHVVMLIVSVESRIFGNYWHSTARTQPRRPQRELRIVNDYFTHSVDNRQRQQQQQEYIKPVETTVPEPVPETVERQQEKTNEPPIDTPPMPAPQTPRDIQHNAIERPVAADTKPRQSEQISKLSRQSTEKRPQRNEAVHLPILAAPSAQSSAIDARNDGLRQQPAESQASRMQTSPDPAATAKQDVSTVARRAAERMTEPDTRSAPTLPRQVANPASVSRVDLRTGESPAVSKETSPTELEPARTTTRQQLTASPAVSSTIETARSPQLAPVVGSSPRRELPTLSQPELAQSPVPVSNRQPRTTARPDAISSAATVNPNAMSTNETRANIEASGSTISRAGSASPAATDVVAAGAPNTPASASASNAGLAARAATAALPTNATMVGPTPRVASVARAAAQAATVAAAAQPTSTEPAAPGALAGGGSGLPRQSSVMSAAGASVGPNTSAATSTMPSVAATNERARSGADGIAESAGTSANHLTRAGRRSAVATSATLAETPRTVTADAGGDQPNARPSRLAMTQSLGGIAGVGQTPNLDRSPSTPGSPSTTASGSARRAEATQNTPPGPALAPSASSVARRALVGANQPSASMRANIQGVAEAAGSERPGELNASSGGSLVRQDARAKSGETTASKGTADIDLGPTRVADAGGFERAAGGGQPEINLDSDSPRLSRTRAGGTAAAALATTTVDVAAASPLGGDQTAAGELTAGGTATRQSAESGVSGSAAVKGELQPGAGSSPDTRQQIAASAVTRTEASADLPGMGQAGGGSAEDEEEKKRRLARSRAGSGPAGTPAGLVAVPSAAATDPAAAGAESGALSPAGTGGEVARQAANTGGGPIGRSDQIAAVAPTGGGNIVGEPTMQRAEAADGVAGPAMPGGGTGGQQRAASGRELVTNVRAAQATLAGAPASSGSPRGADAATQGVEMAPTTNGVLERATQGPVGAVAGDIAQNAAPQSGMDTVAGIASRTTVDGDAPAIGEAATSGAPISRSGRTQRNAGPVTAPLAGAPSSPMSVAVDGADLQEAAIGSGGSTARQQSAGALPIDVAGIEGPGGLGDRVALNVGVNSRLATEESVDVQTTPSRFIRQEIGGAPKLSTSAVFSAEAFRSRGTGRSSTPMRGGAGSAGPQTEEAIELGLAYLSHQQLTDGSWTLRSTTEPVQLASDTAATGLCLLAFQGAGYNHREHRYAPQVGAGIDYLVKNQKPDGDLFVQLDDLSNRSVWLYSHGIAAIALCEAYGMTHDPKLRDPAQKALDFIVATQDPKRGGWRYQPGVESDTSVTGWMMMALKSGELAGLKVPRATYDQISRWLDTAQGSADERHLYRYNPFAPDTDTQRHGRTATPTMTAVGLLMRLYSGWRRDHPMMIAGAEHLRQNLPSIGTTREPLRDTYYWYYGTQVMFHMGGAMWEEWNNQLHQLLLESQIKQGDSAGSWSPRTPVPDRWAPHAGRLYVTTMNLLSLEVTYRHLPLYAETGK